MAHKILSIITGKLIYQCVLRTGGYYFDKTKLPFDVIVPLLFYCTDISSFTNTMKC